MLTFVWTSTGLPGGIYPWAVSAPCTHPHEDCMTPACENITFAQLRLRAVVNKMELMSLDIKGRYLCIQEAADCLTSWHSGSELPSLSPVPLKRDTGPEEEDEKMTDAQLVGHDVIQVR